MFWLYWRGASSPACPVFLRCAWWTRSASSSLRSVALGADFIPGDTDEEEQRQLIKWWNSWIEQLLVWLISTVLSKWSFGVAFRLIVDTIRAGMWYTWTSGGLCQTVLCHRIDWGGLQMDCSMEYQRKPAGPKAWASMPKKGDSGETHRCPCYSGAARWESSWWCVVAKISFCTRSFLVVLVIHQASGLFKCWSSPQRTAISICRKVHNVKCNSSIFELTLLEMFLGMLPPLLWDFVICRACIKDL